jgi:diguanylate cyclase (GGDEF)-like protein
VASDEEVFDPPTLLVTQRSRVSSSRLVPTLTVLEGTEVGSFHVLRRTQAQHTLGRAEDADVSILAPSVSRYHAICVVAERNGHQAVRIRDNDSTNGVMVNGRPCRESWLISGDKVRLGDVLLRFEWMAEEETAYHSDLSARVRAAERDHLTGLLNRTFLDERLGEITTELDGRGMPICAVFIDLDRFKEVNDVHGHLVGDEVLQRTAEVILDRVDRNQPAVRYGGEEIVVLLPMLGVEEAAVWAQRLRAAIAAIDYADVADGLRVTASLGVAERRAGEPRERWFERADQALYRAKEEGRDRVFLAAPTSGRRRAPRDTQPSFLAEIDPNDKTR